MSGAPASLAAKIVARERLLAEREAARAAGKVFVFTNGCFDLLHRGHVELLAEARALGDVLTVGLNSDASVGGLKGEGRPLQPEADRAVILAGLASVTWVTLFDEETPRDLVAALLPDVLVKGGDYRPEDVVGREETERAGGKLVLVPLREGLSTSALVARIRAGS